MVITVIGLGSMGRRRIRLIREINCDYIVIGVDTKDERRKQVEKEFDINTFSSVSDIDLDVECAFVCTSPLVHNEIIRECLNRDWNVFTELNLVDDGYEDNIALAKRKNKALFLSSTFLYREETRYIKSKIEPNKRWNYIYHIGQYLPDWHPWENYNDFFVGDNRTNGCREILAIELPWLTDAFGDIEQFDVLSDKITNLEITYNDNFLIQIKHRNGNKGVLVVDVVSPVAVRLFETYTEGEYISWSGTPESLKELRNGEVQEVMLNEQSIHKDGYKSFIVENAYRNEIQEFLDVVLNGKNTKYDFEKDWKILKIIDKIGA